jgi:aspartyl/asparaginyl-tRNA synthetase
MVFFELRQQTDTIQALLAQSSTVSKQMYKFAASINPESIVLVKGNVTKSPIEIHATTVKNAEIHIAQVYLASIYTRLSQDFRHLRVSPSTAISNRRCSTARDGRGVEHG